MCPGLVTVSPSGKRRAPSGEMLFLQLDKSRTPCHDLFPVMHSIPSGEIPVSQSLAKNLIHLVFSTKDRRPLIGSEIRDDLHRFSAGILRDLHSDALVVNSVSDHIHLLFNLHKTKSLSDVIMELKRGTSIWIKQKDPSYSDFYWQGGYGAFSVSQSAVATVKRYIADQETHHSKQTFQNEFRKLLNRHEIDFDERYVWD